jgi:hypothetical protein
MHSLISIVGVVLFGQENYQEWFRKIKKLLFLMIYGRKFVKARMTMSQSNLQMPHNLQFGRLKIKRHML